MILSFEKQLFDFCFHFDYTWKILNHCLSFLNMAESGFTLLSLFI
jgi:hypothetical protein